MLLLRMRPAWCAAALAALAGSPGLAAQTPAERPVRRPSAAETGCDTTAAASTEPVFVADSVDQPVEARRLPIEGMPIRIREVLTGRSVFRFVVERSGRIDRCSIEVVEETSRAWSDAVLKELRVAHYEPGRKGGQPVRQLVYQVFTYHSDGRLQRPR
ncbi:MAG TPA: hypothetical protein VFT84_09665 [Gemmatimonadales bacterium]|nr:hypothetical protein [Gemmatimonadales bacterium]